MFSRLVLSMKHAWQDARRNVRLSSLTVLLAVIAFVLVDVFFFLHVLTNSTFVALEERFDMVLYFQPDTPEKDIVDTQKEVEAYRGVRSVEYVSRFEALSKFEERHKKNPALMEVLQLFETNPLGGRLIVGLTNPSAFPSVKEAITTSDFAPLLLTTDFANFEEVLHRAESVSTKARRVVGVLLVFFAFVALISVYSTVNIRLAVYNDDIQVMQAVGATKSFIHFPFLILSLGYVLSALLINGLLLGIVYLSIGGELTAFFMGLPVNPVEAFGEQLFTLTTWKIIVGALLIGASTLLALRKHTRHI